VLGNSETASFPQQQSIVTATSSSPRFEKNRRGLRGGRGEATKKDRKIAKTPKNSTFKSLSTIFVQCMKTQGGHDPLSPNADAHG